MWHTDTTFSGKYNYSGNATPAAATAGQSGNRQNTILFIFSLGLALYIIFGGNTNAATKPLPAIATETVKPKAETKKPAQPKKETKQPETKTTPVAAELPVVSGNIVMTAAPADPATLVPKNVQAYIEQWAPVAIREHRRTGVPASISLAQGIVESHAGFSILAVSAKNHFGLKCHEKHRGKAGHCVNYTDDVDKDFFILFQNAAKSWTYHSDLLCKGRYKKLHGRTWKDWCTGLQEVGYATSKTYSKALIAIIERYKLYEYDKGY